MELYENIVLNRRRRAEWEMDFSATYLLHAFSMSHYLDHINPKTILSRTSNFGVATFDVVKKMKADGLVSGDEDGKELLESAGGLDVDESKPAVASVIVHAEDVVDPTEVMDAAS